MDKKACCCILLAGSCWGFLGFYVRHMTAMGLDLIQIIFLKMFFGILFLSVFCIIKDRSLFCFHLRDIWFLAASGLISLLAFNLFYYKAMEYTTLAVAVALLYVAPAFSMLFSAILFKERVTARKVCSVIVIIVGCSCAGGLFSGKAYLTFAGLCFSLLAALSYSLYGIFGKFASERGYHPYTTSLYNMIFAFLAVLPFVDFPGMISVMSVPLIICGIGIGVPSGAIAYVLYTSGVKTVDPGAAMVLGTAEPVVGTLLSVFVFREPMTFWIILGIVLIILGIIVMSLEQNRIQKEI